MKEFHPEYLVINRSGERVGYLLRETNASISAKDCDTTKPLKYVDWAEFTTMVREGRVQLLELNAQGRPSPTYSDEELQELRRMSKKIKQLSEEMWYKSECAVYDDFVGDSSRVSIGLVCCRRMSIVKSAIMLQGCVYAPGCGDAMESILHANSLLVKRMAKDSFICNWAMTQLEAILCNSTLHASLCTRTMRNTDNSIYQTKMLGLSPVSESEAECYADMLESLICDNEGPGADEDVIVQELFAQACVAFQGITEEDVRNAARESGISSMPIGAARKKYIDALVILMSKKG